MDESEEKERKSKNIQQFIDNALNGDMTSENTTTIDMTVTSNVKGTANLVSGPYYKGDKPTDYYYTVNTYNMDYQKTEPDGKTTTDTYEVLRYGVKMNKHNGTPYYQGFGAPNEPTEDVTYTLYHYKVSDHYTGGYFPITNKYLLHAGMRDPTGIPDQTSGRLNYGCIAVCGGRWKNLVESMGFTYKQTQDTPQTTIINITIQPLTIVGTPTAIKK